ncbi:MAG: lysine--tRNA ligase, partial [Candidatus Diapherotrites archaeon]|nr:lysine--tRNA ligase [Candidatus Diapherotrites archaeon]
MAGIKEKKAKAASKPDSKNESSEKEHWADNIARQVIALEGKKGILTVAAGITPSGIIHIGNFREIITVDLVARALRKQGKKVRFLYSWDEFDVFRKVPSNIQNQEEFEKYLRMSIADIPDPDGCHNTYALHFEKELEQLMPLVGITPEFLYQAGKYKVCEYAEEIRTALRARDKIKEILNKWRAEEHGENWIPFLVFCEKCGKDDTQITKYDEEYQISYTCHSCNHKDSFDFRKKGIGKLPWRIDWPMRWFFEKVDFEPSGKDHSSEGGSRTTANDIVKEVYGFDAPVHLMYEFVYAKGQSEKMSKSKGNTITLGTALEVYEPSIVRYLFASTIPGRSFNISFDADLINTYEQFDKIERIYFGAEKSADESELAFFKRVYELSCVELPKSLPFQPSFRHLTVVLQSNAMNIEKTINHYSKELKTAADGKKLELRINLAKNWLETNAPEDFLFTVQENPSETAMVLPAA